MNENPQEHLDRKILLLRFLELKVKADNENISEDEVSEAKEILLSLNLSPEMALDEASKLLLS